eukprot:3705691-Pleurochrysis_carterae.AAC.4
MNSEKQSIAVPTRTSDLPAQHLAYVSSSTLADCPPHPARARQPWNVVWNAATRCDLGLAGDTVRAADFCKPGRHRSH